MKLIEALRTVKGLESRKGSAFTCNLATGFNSLHLDTFLAAELGQLIPNQRVEIRHGLYGDFLGNLDRLTQTDADCGVVLLEWSDLDPRLGIRSSAAWSPSVCTDILSTARVRGAAVQHSIEQAGERMAVVLCLPTLPLLPVSFVPGWQASSFEIELRAVVQSLSAHVSRLAQVRVLSSQRIDFISPLSERHDVESELKTGFPYRLPHCSALANLLAFLVRNPVPKKGLITDLDDTLWRGIVGEVGLEGISWDLDHHSQMHAFYQRLLGTLSAEGVLIGVASKNDPAVVEKAFGRNDLVLNASSIFPMEVSWGPKSESVARILKIWNVGPDSVVFVDDSALELAEVKASHPDVECLQFPTNDSSAVYALALRLRDLFGKTAIREEDTIRAESIRRSHAGIALQERSKSTPTAFIEQVEAEINFNLSKSPLDPRAFELVNKTNQFNLNGRRYTESSWRNYFVNPSSFLLVVSYIDKFGPLGKIAVIAGYQREKRLIVDTWVMSCRAFSRRIEYKCVEELFTSFDVDQIELDFVSTDRNGPFLEFLTDGLKQAPTSPCVIYRHDVMEGRGQRLQEATNG